MTYRALRLLTLVWLKVWCRMSVKGVEHVPRSGPVLVASNHLSFLDSIVIPVAVPRRVRFLAKSDYFTGTGPSGAWNRFFFTAVGAVAVPRGSHADAQAALHLAKDVLDRGEAFGIYPEGTRSRDGRLYRGRTGVAWLALETGAPVVPVAVRGTDRVQPVDSKLVHPHKIVVEFGEPVPVEAVAHLASAGQKRRALTDLVMERVQAMSGQEPAGAYNDHQSPTG
ncbi:lysophospholipid acyltransferase family protein [Angustibacter speluncae]